MDRTLTDEDLIEKADDGLIENFSEDSVKQASYDFRAGRTVVKIEPGRDPQWIELRQQESVVLHPGTACTFYSHETVSMPKNLKGRLSIRSKLANQKLLYAGGVIDPGYKGYLFFTFFNLGHSPIEVEYQDPIVTGEFVQVEEVDEPYTEDPIEELPDEMRPPVPDAPMRDWATINRELDRLDEDIENLSEDVDDLPLLRKVVYGLFFAILAGITGVLISVGIQSVP